MLKCRLYSPTAVSRHLDTPRIHQSPNIAQLLRATFTTNPEVPSEEDYNQAREWFKQFGDSPLPKDIGEVNYARSSGPGGQNVNKVNSKAQLRVSLHRLLPLIPRALHQGVRKSRYFADKTSSLLIQADESRKQVANRETCFRKLNDLLLEVYRDVIPGETSTEQKDKVKKLQRSENEARLKIKKLHSSKKASRKGGSE